MAMWSLARTTLLLQAALLLAAFTLPASAAFPDFPHGFRSQEIKTEGATLHVRVGGKGPAILMLHGFGDTGDMWAPLASAMAKDHVVVAPDLRGMGLSSHPERGYDKKTQAKDM